MSLAESLSEWLPFLWFVLAVVLLVALWQSGTLTRLFERVTKFGGFGLTFEFTEESARKTRETVEADLGAIRAAIQRQLAAAVRTDGLQEAFRKVMQEVFNVIYQGSDDKSAGCRATIHIPDPMYANQLYQLLDYVPKGGGSGRTFSSRSGIIGLTWRTQERATWHQNSGVLRSELVRQWGMTIREAEDRRSTDNLRLFLAVPLELNAVPIGVFYFDAAKREDLGLASVPDVAGAAAGVKSAAMDKAKAEADAVLQIVEDEFLSRFNANGMAKLLAGLVREAKRLGPQIDLEGP